MKKIIGILGAAAVLASSAFAVDFSARVYMSGDIANGTIDTTSDGKDAGGANFWQLNKQDQKDSDALILSVDGEKAGASFQFWYNYDGTGEMKPYVRSTSLWFKPIDMLKVSVGDVGAYTFYESIDYWKTPAGEVYSDHATYTYSNYATVEGPGLSLEVEPIEGLWLSAGVSADAGSSFASISTNETDDETYANWGIAAKYSLAGLIDLPLTVGAAYRDEGRNETKIIAIGAEYGQRYSQGIYGFLNARFRIARDTISGVASDDLDADNEYAYLAGATIEATSSHLVLSAIVLDNMVKYQTGPLNVMGRFPVVIRGLTDPTFTVEGKDYNYYEIGSKVGQKKSDIDPSYMMYEIYAEYLLDAFSIYLDIENDHAVTFNSNFGESFLNMSIKPGVKINVGTCALNVGFQVTPPYNDKTNLGWSVPFTASVSF